jgi:predicted nucleic acid-binding protein
MTPVPLQYVVDASVGIKLFLPEAYSERAQILFDLLGDIPPARLYVPDLFYIECANVLWKHIRRTGYLQEEAQQDFFDLKALALRCVSTVGLVSPALDLAKDYAISAYDACYVALSGQRQAPLITADKRLVEKFAPTAYSVRWLGKFSVSPPPPQP